MPEEKGQIFPMTKDKVQRFFKIQEFFYISIYLKKLIPAISCRDVFADFYKNFKTRAMLERNAH
jgi:hypothetical protein